MSAPTRDELAELRSFTVSTVNDALRLLNFKDSLLDYIAALEAQVQQLRHENGTTEHVLTLQTERIAELKALVQQLRERIKSRIDYRLNERLCTMKPEWDDSMTGFNDAWDIVREVFKDEEDAALAATEETRRGEEPKL